MIVGRGGGSIEDLWAFNEKEVAQAVFDCTVPIISAVGHETDTTIIDFVSDKRAPTPSAAAELAVYEYELLMRQLAGYRDALNLYMHKQLEREQSKLGSFKMQLRYLSPSNQLQDKRTYCMKLEDKLEFLMKRQLTDQKHQLAIYIEKLKGLSPLDKLGQGYAFVENGQGQVIHDVAQVSRGDEINIHLINGRILAKTMEIEETDYGI